MRKPRPTPPDSHGRTASADFVIGRDRFAKISAVDGIALTADMRDALARFDREGLDAEERRDAIMRRFTPAR